MTDEEEFAARSQLKWTREGDGWILPYRRRRMSRVIPHVAISQSHTRPGEVFERVLRHPKQHGQPVLVQR